MSDDGTSRVDWALAWKPLFSPALAWEIVSIPSASGPKFEFEAIWVQDSKKTPDNSHDVILWPHGGPHSQFTNQFSLALSFLVQSGFSLILVNFRGSTGFGTDFLESLPGNIGSYDVEDCISALQFIKTSKKMNVDHIHCFGGSHGGFLVTSLLGQFPDMFTRAAARNPVTNIAWNYGISDIPDWCAFESGLEFNPSEPPSDEMMKTMYKMSPISYSSRIKTPLMIMLGEIDKRVPPAQGVDLFRLLKARGVETR